MNHIPSEEYLQRILTGEVEDPALQLSSADYDEILRTERCPRDGRTLSNNDNPRHPGLNRELRCTCGFSCTT